MNHAEQNFLQTMVVTRMVELIDVRSPWNRSLWQLGTIQSVREVLECARATWSGAIGNPGALEHVSSRCSAEVQSDIGIGAQAVRNLLAEKLQQLAPKKNAPKLTTSEKTALSSEIEELTARANRDYLQRWHAQVISNGLTTDSIERTARLILTHLLDDGFDRKHIHGFLTAKLDSTEENVLETIILRGHEMCREPESEYSFAVPLRAGNRARNIPSLENLFLELGEIRREAAEISKDAPGAQIFNRLVSQDSAAIIGLSASARDPHAAATKVYERLRKIEERATVGRGVNGVLAFSPVILDRTNKKLRNRRSENQAVIVPSLDRHNLYTQDLNTQLDNALGLLSSRQHLSSVASVAMLWAAVEGLLGHPGAQGIDAADGLAAIVACSFPRAELEDLLDKTMREDIVAAGLRSELNDAQGSTKAGLLLEALRKNGSTIFTEVADIAAASRILQIDADPQGTLTRVQKYFVDVFRRLYYQRNFIMHAAKFDSVSLPSTISSAPKLVAAGVDRVVHAQYVRKPADPLALAVRAQIEISLLGQDGSRDIYRLLK